ncbi:MAG: hypothetical protein OJF60_000366 [Burkholderiaceae bacterium]|jgi:hypothetical protein|nr:MAG: hypothetical protein OJF60_000366 [Burkholderiaceae bacterium]
MLTDSDIEIRPVFEMEDFADIMTPQAKEQEENLRRRTSTWK